MSVAMQRYILLLLLYHTLQCLLHADQPRLIVVGIHFPEYLFSNHPVWVYRLLYPQEALPPLLHSCTRRRISMLLLWSRYVSPDSIGHSLKCNLPNHSSRNIFNSLAFTHPLNRSKIYSQELREYQRIGELIRIRDSIRRSPFGWSPQ